MEMSNDKFYGLARKHQGRINPYAVLCQCNWETRKNGRPWQSELFINANNAAGLKKWAGWQTPVYDKISWEQKPDGTTVNHVSSFCKYKTAEEFLTNYVKKINDAYPVCVERADNFWGYFAGLFQGKYGSWATDQAYFAKLCNVAIELAPGAFGQGSLWRNKLLDSLEYAIQKGYLTKVQSETVMNLIRQKVSQINIKQDIPASTAPTNGKIICIDAGHGGSDSGAPSGNVLEKDCTLIITQHIGKELVRRGFDVRYTRVTDVYVSRPERARIANEINANVFISVHCNSHFKPGSEGHEVWIGNAASAPAVKLANLVCSHWSKQLPNTVQRGVKRKDYDVLVLTKMPAILDEIGFLSNPKERAQIIDPEYQQRYATIIANAVEDLFRG